MYLYLKALHIIFIVTWFAGLFYFPRLFIYNTEANDRPKEIRDALQTQFVIMMKRLWYGITWPSAALTLVFGLWVLIKGPWLSFVLEPAGRWLLIKLILVLFLYLYHFSLHFIFKQQIRGIFRYSSQQLRIWNEVATIFLIAIVMLVVVREKISMVWGIVGLILFIAVLMGTIKIYKILRQRQK